MTPLEAKESLDSIIRKARIHLYKPIQIAEILYRDRISGDIELEKLETYRTKSKTWRDAICVQFLGRVSTSSAKYQDNLFEQNACPPEVLVALGTENKKGKGIVESYIYKKFSDRFSMMNAGLEYASSLDKSSFQLSDFMSFFWKEPGLRRSIDKIYEIVVYALFSALTDDLNITVEVSIPADNRPLFEEFKDFAKSVIAIDSPENKLTLKGRVNRVGVTNAADRGLDMWANFGMAIQIKHLSLTEELAEEIVSSVSSDRIVIVCKDSEEKTIISLLNQIGWKSHIQSIITETNLINWYEKALRGQFSHVLGDHVLNNLRQEIMSEFPSTEPDEFKKFFEGRKYHLLSSDLWQ